MSRPYDELPINRNLHEQVRDIYLDNITTIILSSKFRGRIRFYTEEEYTQEALEQDGNSEMHIMAHKLSPGTLELILNSGNELEVLNLYIRT